MITVDRAICTELRKEKYALILAEEFSISSELAADRQHLWSDWNNLKLDNYLKDGGRFRQRRFGLFYLLPSSGELLPLKSVPYIQSRKVNAYAGGIMRKFAPLSDTTLTNQFLHSLIKFNFQQFPVDSSMKCLPWEIDVHQFRIMASENEQGQPTPEGIHHDGDDFNCIHLIGRQNAKGGVNTVYDNDRNKLKSCTLLQPMDSIIVWDPHVMHGVSPIMPENPSESAIRDVLVIGYNYRPDLKRPE
ncbi:MAG: 2OG-Fe dioxygenase family protein [Alcanivoracaceae bacterium]|nr:2OG-Fe dioxygenase family protein [Alcanivoracaceae bacterium]